MRKFIALAACAALVLAGCQTQNAYTGESQTSNATRGAIIGGILGAGAGALTNTSSGRQSARNALIGAGIGALAGTAIGGYMDEQEARLRDRLRSAGVSVRRTGPGGQYIQLVMASDVTFDTGQAIVKPQFLSVLAAVGDVLREYDRTMVEVSGHTDSQGSDAFNQDLSQRRAYSVADILVQNGVMPQRLIPRGYGETRPVASNATAGGRAANRRVEIQIIPFTS